MIDGELTINVIRTVSMPKNERNQGETDWLLRADIAY
jgi:hypothetical protein